jgi:hypothetical protein
VSLQAFANVPGAEVEFHTEWWAAVQFLRKSRSIYQYHNKNLSVSRPFPLLQQKPPTVLAVKFEVTF